MRYRVLPNGVTVGEETLRWLEQMLDEGDAHLEPIPTGWFGTGWFTHRLVSHLGGPSWRVRVRTVQE